MTVEKPLDSNPGWEVHLSALPLADGAPRLIAEETVKF
jgi:hypothetical protein